MNATELIDKWGMKGIMLLLSYSMRTSASVETQNEIDLLVKDLETVLRGEDERR